MRRYKYTSAYKKKSTKSIELQTSWRAEYFWLDGDAQFRTISVTDRDTIGFPIFPVPPPPLDLSIRRLASSIIRRGCWAKRSCPLE